MNKIESEIEKFEESMENLSRKTRKKIFKLLTSKAKKILPTGWRIVFSDRYGLVIYDDQGQTIDESENEDIMEFIEDCFVFVGMFDCEDDKILT